MTKDMQVLLDKQAIYEVLIRYCRGADRCDEELIRSVYHDDAYDDHGYWRGTGSDFARFLPARLTSANVATTHSITNVLIEVDGDTARSESQVMATLVRIGSPRMADVMGARYLDRLSRRNGEWKIDERTVVLDWHKVEAWVEAEAPIPLDGFTRGDRFPVDPVYRLMATEPPR
ncbi:nuclear transport factor 2 family protein [Pseudomonas taiwanensis]|uniref:nuclear transport factor 2 family protein n=1 Tax=Pseudomonas TaxID=286 RepID=UPI0015BDA072|nr:MULTISPECIES: nuclear transport factor 2 family protein [Pseudomonas]MDH4560775.1 nuclear transport factor 2 family protein [Pseudomonas sp. BN411]MDH4653727.1 nuclear transport factor 2 family protein [Pseudomonas sp. BN606]MDH4874124.1 nuclear transport factor 2 family protein [Pseudomonas sp. BN515]NWL75756.1 nuclear transport factor 2 family protein [Pseudomonas taiwanensis]